MAQKNEVDNQNAIDRLNDNLSSASEKVAANKKIIYWVVGIIAVCAAFTLSYLFIYRNPRLNKAYEAYNEVEIKAMGNDSIAAAEYKKVADSYGSNDAGKLAALSAAESYYNMGKYKEAAAELDRFSTSEPVLEANAKVLEGDCYVNLKNYDKALSCFDKALSLAKGNEQIAVRVLLKEANIYDAQKKYDKALSCYETIKKEYPNFQPGNGAGIDAYIEREKARLGK
ncbi:MAG: tetratricopeptide repeat protein [Bacteroides sp.]|nr:tetratricopeptide repeat protein [Bacteroides sp.]MDE6230545.1 tetratricopeptide repeat protein [Muribaculaceae bacterium]